MGVSPSVYRVCSFSYLVVEFFILCTCEALGNCLSEPFGGLGVRLWLGLVVGAVTVMMGVRIRCSCCGSVVWVTGFAGVPWVGSSAFTGPVVLSSCSRAISVAGGGQTASTVAFGSVCVFASA